jgi:hypothetical protein
MKSAFILSIFLTAFTWTAMCGADETKSGHKVTHHVQFLFGNYASINSSTSQFSSSNPMYSYSVGFNYMAEFTPSLGLKTGLNYFTYGTSGEILINEEGPKIFIFSSYIHLPINLVAYKSLRRGRLVVTAGPDFYFPTNTYSKYTGPFENRPVYHTHESPSDFFKQGSFGFSAGVGYEKKFSNRLSIAFLPDFRVLNIIPFNILKPTPGQLSPWPNGVKMGLGLSTYITFY